MSQPKVSDDDLIRMLQEGSANADISAATGLSIRNIQRRKSLLRRQLSIPPTAPPVPTGFEVTKLSTRLDAAGNTTGQNVQAKPIPDEAPIEDLIPAGHVLKGISSYVVDGEVRGQWVKTTRDTELAALAQVAAIAALSEKIEPLDVIRGPDNADADLANLFTLTDCHVGMLAWAREAGEAWDLKIAEQVLVDTFLRMIDSAPDAEVGIINQLGDWLHWDGLTAVTPTSGHILDADSRYQKMVEVAVRILEKIIYAAAQKHPTVRVYMHEGNHDMAGSVWLRVLFARVFRDNPRITVEESPLPYVALQHGQTMLGFHHGHLTAKASLPLIFAAQFSEMWGGTKFRHIHTGHLHHIDEKEYPGVVVEQHPTLAANDAHGARHGYRSVRRATSRTYHKRFGEIARATFLPLE